MTPPKNFPTPSNGRPRSAASARQPRVNLSHALLYPPNLPREPVSAFPVLLGRGVELPLVVGYVGWQLGRSRSRAWRSFVGNGIGEMIARAARATSREAGALVKPRGRVYLARSIASLTPNTIMTAPVVAAMARATRGRVIHERKRLMNSVTVESHRTPSTQ